MDDCGRQGVKRVFEGEKADDEKSRVCCRLFFFSHNVDYFDSHDREDSHAHTSYSQERRRKEKGEEEERAGSLEGLMMRVGESERAIALPGEFLFVYNDQEGDWGREGVE